MEIIIVIIMEDIMVGIMEDIMVMNITLIVGIVEKATTKVKVQEYVLL